MIEVKMSFPSVAALIAFFSESQVNYGRTDAAPEVPATAPVVDAEKPKRTRKKDAEPAAAAPTAPAADTFASLGVVTGAAAPDFVTGLLGPSQSAALPPAQRAVQPAPAVVQAVAPAQPGALTQQTVIKTFVQLAQTPGKGNPAVKAVLESLGFTTVGMIPPEKWGEAVKTVQKALAE